MQTKDIIYNRLINIKQKRFNNQRKQIFMIYLLLLEKQKILYSKILAKIESNK